jgi:hypothetical protein
MRRGGFFCTALHKNIESDASGSRGAALLFPKLDILTNIIMKKLTRLGFLGIALSPFTHAANLSLLVSGGISNFDTAVGASSRSDVPISGLRSGESLVGLDYRPATGVTYGISSASNIYTVNTLTGVTSQLGSSLSPVLMGSAFGFDYNPAFMGGQFARIISDTDNNVVIDGTNGGYLGGPKTNVFYAAGDPNEGANPNINHIACTNSVFGATSTQQFGIDTDLDLLTTVANNAGTLVSVGGLGIDASSAGGFDIDGASGDAFAAFVNPDGITSTLYQIDLENGSATSLFSFAGTAEGLTSVPEPSSALLTGLAGLAMLARRKR